jgi:hypothetical protein
MATSKIYFVIYRNQSHNSFGGLSPRLTWTFEKTIIEAATSELRRAGKSFEDMANISLLEDTDGNYKYARELDHNEIVNLSVKKLSDDGRLYMIFDTDADSAEAFIQYAATYSLENEARALVDKFHAYLKNS